MMTPSGPATTTQWSSGTCSTPCSPTSPVGPPSCQLLSAKTGPKDSVTQGRPHPLASPRRPGDNPPVAPTGVRPMLTFCLTLLAIANPPADPPKSPPAAEVLSAG